MDRNKIKILIIMLGVLLILAVLFLLFSKMPKQEKQYSEENQQNIETSSGDSESNAPVQLREDQVASVKDVDFREEDLKMISLAFAERFGTYSNQASFGNIKELKIQMTSSMQNWVDSYIKETKATSEYSGSYEAIETRAVTANVISFDKEKGISEINVLTSRAKIAKDGSKEQFRQNLNLKLNLVNGQWLVDNAKWAER